MNFSDDTNLLHVTKTITFLYNYSTIFETENYFQNLSDST